jgi:hypothetical protein
MIRTPVTDALLESAKYRYVIDSFKVVIGIRVGNVGSTSMMALKGPVPRGVVAGRT